MANLNRGTKTKYRREQVNINNFRDEKGRRELQNFPWGALIFYPFPLK